MSPLEKCIEPISRTSSDEIEKVYPFKNYSYLSFITSKTNIMNNPATVIVLLLFFFISNLNAQIVEIESTDQGVIFPLVSDTDDVTAPSQGMVVYQTSNPAGLYQHNGTSWSQLGNGGAGGSAKPQMFTAFTGIFSSQERFGMFGNGNRAPEIEAQYPMTQTGRINNFCVFLGSAIALDASVEVVLRKNGVDTALEHTFDSQVITPTTLCTTTGIFVNYEVGDLISVRFSETQDVDPGSPYFMCTMDFTPN